MNAKVDRGYGAMKLWLPYVTSGSGSDVYTSRLAGGLRRFGWQVEITPFPARSEFMPWRLRRTSRPPAIDVIVANSWNAFAFAQSNRVPLIAVEHHCIFDSEYEPYKRWAQSVYHRVLIRRFEERSFRLADAVVGVSRYTADAVTREFGIGDVHVIHNGIDSRFWQPDADVHKNSDSPYRLLFVGNLSERKGADLLPKIMAALGPGYELTCVLGLRARRSADLAQHNIRVVRGLCVGELRNLYSSSDLLLFPSRLEGFGYAIAEAMACETPVVASNVSAIPELVIDGVTGMLCNRDDIGCFVSAIRALCQSREKMSEMGRRGRQRVLKHFTDEGMAREYDRMLRKVVAERRYNIDRESESANGLS